MAHHEERRRDNRTAALFRTAILTAPGFEVFCLLKNISSGGVLAVVFAPMEEGCEVLVQIGDGERIAGSVAWVEGDQIGIQFHQPIEVDGLLARFGKRDSNGFVNRAPRLKTRAKARFGVQGRTHILQVQDVSSRGLCAVAQGLGRDDEGQLVLAGAEPRQAVVRWVRDDRIGLYFLKPLRLCELTDWVAKA
jgi:hypothetical protein